MHQTGEVVPSKPSERRRRRRSRDGKFEPGAPTLKRPESTLETAPIGSAFTSITPIIADRTDALIEYLLGLGTNIRTTTEIAFANLTTVHFMRWVVVRDTTGAPWLAFETNYDGTLESHLEELLRFGSSGMHGIYRHCEGYPFGDADRIGDHSVFRRYVQRFGMPTLAFHVGVHNRTALRIRREQQIRDAVERFVDDARRSGSWDSGRLDSMYDQLLQSLDEQGLLVWAREKAEPPPKTRPWAWLVRIIPIALVLVPFALPLYILLRIREALDEQDPETIEPPAIRLLAQREDFQVQNQLTHLVDVKPGIFRHVVLRGVLYAIDLLARYQFNQGALGGITTIHFARWLFIDKGKRLLFFSNYDGSWESYLGDFIDKAHSGLTGVWSNTKGFPKTKNLVQDGATDEERFKSWTRSHQVPTQLWYSAYPTLTVFNIQQNARICAGLQKRPETPAEMLAFWLSL